LRRRTRARGLGAAGMNILVEETFYASIYK
jgi:hypothetical protein